MIIEAYVFIPGFKKSTFEFNCVKNSTLFSI
jgi:hypothetical protein